MKNLAATSVIALVFCLFVLVGCPMENDNGNENGNTNVNTNVNTNLNTNDNTNQNQNLNVNGNMNENGNTNGNDNTNDNDNTNENGGGTDTSAGNLFTSTFDSSNPAAFSEVFEFDGATIDLVRKVFTHIEPSSNPYFTFGSDGHIYSSMNDKVQQHDGTTGELIGSFVSAGAGGLRSASSLVFNDDGDLLVIDADEEILKFDGDTGDFVSTFVAAGTGGMQAPLLLSNGPNGNLFVLNVDLVSAEVSVLEFDGSTGTFEGEFVSAGSGGVVTALDMAFGPNGNLYIPDSAGGVAEFSGASGASLGRFFNGQPTLTFPTALTFGPDGDMYVLASVGVGTTPAVVQINGATGEIRDTFFRNELSIRGFLQFKPDSAAP